MHIAVHLRRYAAGRIGGQENIVRHLIAELVEQPLAPGQQLTLIGPPAEADALQALAPGAEVAALDEGADETDVHSVLEKRSVDLLVGALMQLEPTVPAMPSAVLIPDLQHEFLPENFSRAELDRRHREYRPAALHARRVITISEHAKRSLVERYGMAPERVRVAPPGADNEFGPESDPEAAAALVGLNLPDEYVYYPANFWPHKNHETLFRALRLLRERGSRLDLVLTGARDSGFERIEQTATDLGVRYLGRLPRPQVAELMRRARALVFPSRFEGFGIPIVEAFACGTPVVASNATACPETAGDAALLVDPDDTGALADAIERTTSDEATRRRLRQAGFDRAQASSWGSSRAAMREALLEALEAPAARFPRVAWRGPPNEFAETAAGAGALVRSQKPRGVAISRQELFRDPDAARRADAVFRVDALEEVGDFPADGDAVAEYETWLRIADRYPVVSLGEPPAAAPPSELDRAACRRAVRAVESRGATVPYEWRVRQAEAWLGARRPRTLVALATLAIGLRESPGRRRAFFAEWRRRNGL